MNVLLSVKPKYVEAILSGAKKYEFRRTIFKRKDVKKIYIYSNSSIKKIVGFFETEKILEGTPEEIWKQCHEYAAISKEDFFKYFQGTQKALAIKIKNVQKFSKPIDPYIKNNNFTPPQSFCYISEFIFERPLTLRKGGSVRG